ncbi:alpha-1,2-fucosyltransferase, putative [Ectocarpus siliculosus]|uniref:Alpha-1,2-fucosyltransferase, putative n=1 Tax=Ectocarpus siliculosus TaxID=2880 RepID=D7G104_ECTSI|nr:alpha-1,2-fucosyltransferase, putative [Ectocarpus siliculosus]|eukprot:CBJ33114.1 alpha-1,2-fucosyltransferase, putative [Ectocarpus siliculosus]
MRVVRKLVQLLLLAAIVIGTGYLFAFGPRASAPAPQQADTTTTVDGLRSPDNLDTVPGSEHRPPGKDIPAAAAAAAAGAERPATNDDDATTAATRGPGIVRLNFMGRLGNNLFEYAAARALADRLGFALSIQPAPYNRKKFGLLTRPEGMACFPGVRPVGPARSSPEMVGLETVKFRGVRRELGDPTPRSIEMEGWFQDYSMFKSEKDRLRKIMALDPSCCGPTAPGPGDLVIHHRNYRAELTAEQYEKLIFKDLDYEFYEAVLRDAAESAAGPPETVWVVGEFNDEEPLFKRLQQDHPNVKRAEMVEDQFHAFCFLSRAPRLVMAHSTFSWWVAFLGVGTEVHFPLTRQNQGVTGPSIAVDEGRYVYRDEAGRVVPPP